MSLTVERQLSPVFAVILFAAYVPMLFMDQLKKNVIWTSRIPVWPGPYVNVEGARTP